MGSSYGEFVKYPRTSHLFGSKGTDDDKHLGEPESRRFIADKSLIVEEKLDGTNVGIHFTSDDGMVLQCRGHLITEGMHPQYDLFKQWAAVKRPVLEDRLSDRFILFGEWVYARHSVHYRQLPHYFFEFDIYDKQGEVFLVWTHTKMVCAQLPLLEEWSSLTSHEQTILFFTGLFHDSGKPLTSLIDPDTGRTTSPKHALKAEKLARSILRNLGCDLTTREEICRLVRFHGRPAFLLEKSEPSHEVVSLSWLVSNKLLYLFALADTRGRKTVETSRPEENLHLWKLVAEENDCFDQPYPFANDRARFLFYRQERPNLHYVPFEGHRCTVTVMSGLPGSGKDAWLAANRPGLPVVSLDDVRGELDIEATDDQGQVIQVGRERCREHLRSSRSFAFNATNIFRQTRRRWIDLFADYDARIEIVYVEPSMPIILSQNARRDHPVPEGVIRQLADKCEPPTLAEAHSMVMCSGQESQ